MKVIFSNVKNKEAPTPQWVEMAALSNFYIKRSGFETVFYGDELSLKEFRKIEYDHFEKIRDEELMRFPQCMWSLGKLAAALRVKEPFIHIDSDLLFKGGLRKDLLTHDIVCLHDESFVCTQMQKLQDLFGIKPVICEPFPTISYNCGLVGA